MMTISDNNMFVALQESRLYCIKLICMIIQSELVALTPVIRKMAS